MFYPRILIVLNNKEKRDYLVQSIIDYFDISGHIIKEFDSEQLSSIIYKQWNNKEKGYIVFDCYQKYCDNEYFEQLFHSGKNIGFKFIILCNSYYVYYNPLIRNTIDIIVTDQKLHRVYSPYYTKYNDIIYVKAK